MPRLSSLCALAYLPLALPLTASAQVLSEQKISDLAGGFGGVLEDQGRFGSSVANLGDLDGNGAPEVVVGAAWTNGTGVFKGKVFVLFLNPDGTVASEHEINDGVSGFTGPIGNGSFFGASMARIDSLGGAGGIHLAVGADWDNDGLNNKGAVWILTLDTAGQVVAEQKISATQGGFLGVLDPTDHFGISVASLGDRDGDGVDDIAVGAYNDDDGGLDRGAVWILYLRKNGTVKTFSKIGDIPGTPGIGLSDDDNFGWALANPGDLNGDGFEDLAVGCYDDDDGGPARGAVRILFLDAFANVIGQQKISSTAGGFTATLEDHDHFGSALSALGDLDGDGVEDLAVGVWQDNDGIGTNVGAVYLLFLNTDGTVKEHRKLSATSGGFGGGIADNDWFGSAIASLGDLDGNGRTDLMVGQWGDDDGGTKRGATWVVELGCLDASVVTPRNAGTNPLSLTAAPPLLGGLFQATVDLTTTGHSFAQLIAFASPLTLTLGGGQTLLVNVADPAGELLALGFQPGPLAAFSKAIPANVSFCGFPICTQAIHFGGVVPFALSNAQDLAVGF